MAKAQLFLVGWMSAVMALGEAKQTVKE